MKISKNIIFFLKINFFKNIISNTNVKDNTKDENGHRGFLFFF
jgi:uncharacterized membrane protein YqhA